MLFIDTKEGGNVVSFNFFHIVNIFSKKKRSYKFKGGWNITYIIQLSAG